MLEWDDLLGHHSKIETAVKRLQMFCPEEGYYVAFSGGKDSQCVYHLCEMAGVKFDAHYSVTSVDPPQLVRFIKTQYPAVALDIPHDDDGKPVTMWNLIARKTIPPTRKIRYCCAELKETNGKGRVTVTGVRWAESPRRRKLHGGVDITTKSQKIINNALENVPGASLNDRGGLILNDDNDEARRMVENCYRTRKTIVNPILDWTDDEVWEFLNDYAKVPHCELYDPPYNFKRIGCIGCPMSGSHMREELEMFPKYRDMYIRAFDKMIANHPDAKIADFTDNAERETAAGSSIAGSSMSSIGRIPSDGLVVVDATGQDGNESDAGILTAEELMTWWIYVQNDSRCSQTWGKYIGHTSSQLRNIKDCVKEIREIITR